jgi:hypothetical protein
MAKRVLWRSWCKIEADFEIKKINKLDTSLQWVDGHKHKPMPNDIWLATNGYDYKVGPFKRAALYAESYLHIKNAYDNWNKDKHKWHKRFHFNPKYCHQGDELHNIGCWWLDELPLYEKRRKVEPKYDFGMVLANKGTDRVPPCNFYYYRNYAVKHTVGRSFKYYGPKWPRTQNYAGEKYINGSRGTPVKFTDARDLMADCRFVYAFENVHDDYYSLNYMTEKIFHAFLSNSVPIYAGAGNIQELIPENIFIDARKFNLNIPKIIKHCENMGNKEYNEYLEKINAWLNSDGQKFSYNHLFVQLDKKLQRAFR